MGKDSGNGCKCWCDIQHERVIWISYPSRRITPFANFDALHVNDKRRFWKAFEYWMGGFPPNNEKYHGFDYPHKGCHVFKSGRHRLYGFILHSAHGKQFELRTICIHAVKHGDRTNPGILDRLDAYQRDETIIGVVLALKARKGLL